MTYAWDAFRDLGVFVAQGSFCELIQDKGKACCYLWMNRVVRVKFRYVEKVRRVDV